MSALSYLSPKAEVRPSAIHGRGLFAREAIAKGEMVCVKGGHIFDRRRYGDYLSWYLLRKIRGGGT